MANVRPKVLCLGVSFPNIEAVLKDRGCDHDPVIGATQEKPTADTAIQCVCEKVLNQMDGRDLARCLATEVHCQVDVYCVSREQGAIYREDRHLDANFNRSSFVQRLKKQFGEECQFNQIILDYFWIPAGWDVNHWSMKFFESTLVNFAPLLVASSLSRCNASIRRGIFLPFCFHCFRAIVTFGDKLRKYYNISFLRSDDLSCITLWSGTQQIDTVKMQTILGKRKDQEEFYCTFNARHIREMESGGASKKELLELASSLEDFSSIRFMVLEPLPAATVKSASQQSTHGRFLGLTPISQVRRGIQTDERAHSQNLHSTHRPLFKTPVKRRISFESNEILVSPPRPVSRYNLRQRSPRSTVDVFSIVSSDDPALLPPAILFRKSLPSKK